MCLTYFCLHPTPSKLQLIIGFNREEQTLRKTLPFAQFKQDPNIYGGRDLKSGGTWLGINIETGLLVFLTNYDLPQPRLGRSRGKLVHRFLSTAFLPKQKRDQSDKIIENSLNQILKDGKSYSAFNLTIYNVRTGRAFYMCSEWEQNKTIQIGKNVCAGICNSDINTLWQKTSHGLKKFKTLVQKLGQIEEKEAFDEMRSLFKDRVRFSDKDEDQSSIFVEPYWCQAENAERMTKTTFMCQIYEHQKQFQLSIKQITYTGKQATQTQVNFRLSILK